MAEKTPNQQLAEKLLFKPAYVGDKSAAVKQEAHAFAEGYKKFLDAGKTEREVAAESEQMLKDAGYQQFDPKKTYAPGDKVYFSQLGKAIVASTIGTRSFEDGFHLVIAHTGQRRRSGRGDGRHLQRCQGRRPDARRRRVPRGLRASARARRRGADPRLHGAAARVRALPPRLSQR